MALRAAGLERSDLEDDQGITAYICVYCDIVVAIDSDEHEGEIETVCNNCNDTPGRMAMYRILKERSDGL